MSRLRVTASRVLSRPRAPELVLALGTLIVVVYAARIGVRVTTYALDEIVLKQQAVNYTSGLPGSVLHDAAARGPSRLYSLVQSLVFRVWDGDTAIRHAKQLNAVMFASAAVPVWLLARRLLDSRWAAVCAGLLAIAAPWLSITTVIFTENLSYPLFPWFLLAIAWCLDRPSPRRDLVVLALAGLLTVTRVQLWTVLLLWPIAVWALAVAAPAPGSFARRVPRGFVTAAKRHPATFAVLVGAILYGLYLILISNTLKAELRSNLGTYAQIADWDTLPADFVQGVLVQVVYFTAALAVLPVVGAAAFWLKGLSDRSDERRWRLLFVITVIGVGISLGTVFAQHGYIGNRTEERYFIYLIPLAWIGALGILERRDIGANLLAAVAVPLVLLLAVVPVLTPLTTEYAFLAPGGPSTARLASALGGRFGDLTQMDVFALLASAICIGAIVLWVRRPAWRPAWVVVPALFQVALAIYVFGVIEGRAQGIPSRTDGETASKAFIDRNTPGGARVTWLDVQRKPPDLSAEHRQQETLFWNQKISSVAMDPTLGLPFVTFPLSSVEIGTMSTDPRTGVVTSTVPMDLVVQPVDSPYLQLSHERPVAVSPAGDVALIAPGSPARAVWRSQGLGVDGTVPRAAVSLRAWGSGRVRIALRMTAVADPTGETRGAALARLSFGGGTRAISVRPGDTEIVRVSRCISGRRGVTGSLRARRGYPQVVAVVVTRLGAC